MKATKSRFKGLALVETAIVLLLLMYLTLGVIEYSWLFLKAQQITNAARSGARLGIVNPSDSAIRAKVKTLMDTAGIGVSVYSVQSVIGTNPGDDVKVTITWDAKKVALINAPGLLPLPTRLLNTSVTMAKEGP